MGIKGRLAAILIVLGFITIPLARFGAEFLLVSAFLLLTGTVTAIRSIGGKDRVLRYLGSIRRKSEGESRQASTKIDPLLPVRVLKVAESRDGSLTVSVVAMALNVGLDECQVALDELVRKGAANVDIDLSTGVANYRFPEFLPPRNEGADSR